MFFFIDSENIAPVSEHTGLNGPKYKSTPKSKVLKKKRVNEVLNENSGNFNNITILFM